MISLRFLIKIDSIKFEVPNLNLFANKTDSKNEIDAKFLSMCSKITNSLF